MSLLQNATVGASAPAGARQGRTMRSTEARKILGQPVSRVDGPLKVRGEARFAAEVPLEICSTRRWHTAPSRAAASPGSTPRRRGGARRRAGDDPQERAAARIRRRS